MADHPSTDDVTVLVALNQEVGEAESRADAGFFEELLCGQFVMMRPTGRLDDRRALIDGLSTGAVRRTDDIQVQLFGERRAVVRCTVTKWDGPATEPPADAPRFDNLRVFLRDDDGAWRLLSWLNEPLAQS